MLSTRLRAMICLSSIVVLGNIVVQADDAPKGEILSFTFDQSKIYPGTTRKVSIYIPAQYKADKPACVHVNQDGIQFKANEVFDALIHSGEMPIAIGVFITPGVVNPPVENALPRFNRSFEYDGLGDAYARFLLDEILPYVETKKASDGRAIVLSKEGNDRSIGGSSSGAICAFTAAWERPDAFRRVFSAVGTYVGLRGGQNYSTLVRKYEPKPIRIFLEDGSNDLNIYGGDWWMANQAMERSLKFAGYEVEHEWGEGGHNNNGGTAVFSKAIKWLWKDWPAPVKAGLGSPQLQEILIPGEEWKIAAKEIQTSDGPAVNAKGEVVFSEVNTKHTYRLNPDGTKQIFLNDSTRVSGQAFGPDGLMYTVGGTPEQVLAWDSKGNKTVFADGIRGNDLVVDHLGGVYVTSSPSSPNEPSTIWYVSPKGEKKSVDSGLKFANGVCLSPDHTLLYVSDSRTHWVYSYQVAADGSLANKQKYFHLHVPDTAEDSGADGMRCDRSGRLWVTTRLGLQICDPVGRVNCIVPVPNGKVSNLTFGGENFDTVYCTCGDVVYSRKVKVRGSNGWEQPTVPEKPRL